MRSLRFFSVDVQVSKLFLCLPAEARLRGYDYALDAFPREYSAVADALTYCDMTTSPTGFNISFEERIADILHRYGDEDIVAQALYQATPSLALDVERTRHMVRQHQLSHEVKPLSYDVWQANREPST